MKLVSHSRVERLGPGLGAVALAALLTGPLAPRAAGQGRPGRDAFRPAVPPVRTVTVPTVPGQSLLGPTRYRFSVDRSGPTISITGIREGSILVPNGGLALGPLPTPAIDLTVADLGMAPIPANCQPQQGDDCKLEVDALSAGEDTQFPQPAAAGGAPGRVWYSVDEWANGFIGAPVFPNVRSEGNAAGVDDASADSFISIALPPTPICPPVMPSTTAGAVDGNGLPSMSGALYPGAGLREPNPPGMGAVDVGDNLDALDVNSTAGFPSGGIYYSLDSAFMDTLEGVANTGSAAARGFVGGDVLRVAVAGGAPVVYAPAALLGLDTMGADTDDLDALILAENGDGIYQPSITPHDWVGGTTDMLIFSVRRDSAVIGMLDSICGMPIEEGDLLTTPAGGGATPGIFIAAEALGLATVRSGQPVAYGDDLCGGDYTDIPVLDCRGTGVENAAGIATGAELDLNGDGIPDHCQATMGGEDTCGFGHTYIGSGDQLGVPFTTGTTGTAGQSEANCYAFGSSGIDSDVWFDWTADQTNVGTLTTCSGTSVDTKVAVWPGVPGCPADGTSLACNDDACGLQSTASFPITAGTTYTLQVGTFPGAAGGTGTFDVTQGTPPPCGTYDDGTTENALGLVAGGETGWLHNQECLLTVDSVDTAYGSPNGTPPPNGNASRIACYEDTDCDRDPTTPAGGMSLLWSTTTVATNAATNIINMNPTGGVSVPSRCSWVMATCDQVAGEFPAPMDQTNPTPKAWVVGNTPSGASMDVVDLNNNNVPPLQTTAIGFPTAWLLRAQGTESSGDPFPASCFGDGSGAPCGCGNNGDGAGGCDNSLGAGGAILAAGGVASLSNDSLNLIVTRTTNQPGIFFQGDIEIPMGGGGLTFGDGLRCCGNNVIRCGTWFPSGNATDTDNGNNIGGNLPPISDIGLNATNLMAGDSRCYQWWYRDPAGPCGGSFNLSNAVSATWGP